MAAKAFGGKVAITGTAQTLSALIRTVEPSFQGSTFGAGVLRAEETNAERIYIRNLNGRELGYLRPAEPLDMTNLGSVLHTDSLFLLGDNAGDEIYCFLVEW